MGCILCHSAACSGQAGLWYSTNAFASWKCTQHVHDTLCSGNDETSTVTSSPHTKPPQPHIYREFMDGHFAVQKTLHVFSSVRVDQCHKQVNNLTKGEDGAKVLIADPEGLERWTVAGPGISPLMLQLEATIKQAAMNQQCITNSSTMCKMSSPKMLTSCCLLRRLWGILSLRTADTYFHLTQKWFWMMM